MRKSGLPVTTLKSVTLAGIEIAEDVGTFKATKLNLYIQSGAGRVVMLTSGITTFWSQAVITCLMGMLDDGLLSHAFDLNSWRGNQGTRPCFASIKVGGTKVTDDQLYQQLAEARQGLSGASVEEIMRDAIQILNHAITGGPVEEVEVATQAPTEEPLEF